MGFLIQYVANAAPWIYAACGFVALYQLYRTWQVRDERRQAVFSLEREKSLNDLYNIFVVSMVLLLAMGLTYFVSTTLATAVEPMVAEVRNPTPQAQVVLPTPTNTPLPVTPTPTWTFTPAATPQAVAAQTPEVESAQEIVETPTPAPPPAPPASCPDNRAVLTAPGNGAVVSGMVLFAGVAVHEQFDYYKLEYAPGAGAGQNFAFFADGRSQVENGPLGSLNSNALANGTYTVRLVVVDQTGNFPEPCAINITVQN
jgi:hypothetical protein